MAGIDNESTPFLEPLSYGDDKEGTNTRVVFPGKRRCISVAIISLVIFLVVALIFSAGILVGHFAVPPLVKESSIKEEICAKPPLVVISLDGFWAGYWQRNVTSFLQSVAASGVHAEYMRSAFPTKTFSNHFSIVTGLYPESHGIVNNKFYDTELQEKFDAFSGAPANDPKWWLGEPVWVTAAKSGLKTGIYFWPGSEVKIQGIRPTFYFPYSNDTPFEQRVDTVLGWFDLPQSVRPQFMALYFNEPDHTGHSYGPQSPEVDGALGRVDEAVESFFVGLQQRELLECVNIMVVSDHGMGTYNASRQVLVRPIVPEEVLSDVYFNFYGTVSDMNIYVGNDTTELVYESFVDYVNDSDAVFRPYLREDLPLRLHSAHFNKQRYGVIYLIADIGGYLAYNRGSVGPGQHGYDNSDEEMQAFFLAHGPAFKKDYVAQPFDNTQLYSLMCGLLDITPAENNGTVGALYDMIDPDVVNDLPPAESSSGEPGVVETCPFPTDPETYEERAFCADCICSSCQFDDATIDAANKALDLTPEKAAEYQRTHLPWGAPEGGEGEGSCLLSQPSHITLYSNQLHIPLWVAYKLTKEQVQQAPPDQFLCVRRDPRIEPAHAATCSSYASVSPECVPVPLVAGLSSDVVQELSTSLLTNIAPQCSGFYDSIWGPLTELERSWAVAYGAINVITGVLLDSDHSGERDADSSYPRWLNGAGSVANPSHYFKVVVRCLDDKEPADCDPGRLDALGLLFQHPLSPGSLRSPDEMIEYSLTLIRDIEKATGVNFYPSLSARQQNTIELRITTSLWEG